MLGAFFLTGFSDLQGGKLRRIFFILIINIILIASACSTIGVRNTRSEDDLRERVLALYSLREAGNYFKAYEYENMSLDGEISVQDYASGFRSKGVRDVKIQDVKIDDDTAFVTIKAKAVLPKLQGFDKFNTELDYEFVDKWVFRNNNWYHVIVGQAKEW